MAGKRPRTKRPGRSDGTVGEETGTRDTALGDLTGVHVRVLQAGFTQGGREAHGAGVG